MSDKPIFSVVTPVRNGLPFIQRCVASVRGQGSVLREHIVQDALSSDGTAEWCMSQRDLVVTSEKDAGMYDAINRGWGKASGQYLSWLNADEQYLPGTLEAVAHAFNEWPDVDVIFGDAMIVDPEGRAMAYRREPDLRAWYVKNSFLYAYSCTLFYRRRLWDEGHLKLDSSFRYAADMDLILRLLERGVRFRRLTRPLALFTASGENLSTHDGMRRETELLYERYGAFSSPLLRALTRLPRWIERYACGGFRMRNGSYSFWTNADSPPTEVKYERLGTRYSVFLPKNK